MERTLSIIKPDAVKRCIIGEVVRRLENNKMKISAMKMIHMTKEKAESFYSVHKGKPFFEELVKFMISGPAVVMVLEGNDIITRYRTLMGATDYRNALPGTIRGELANDLTQNVVHGSDSPENAKIEISHFFEESEIVNS